MATKENSKTYTKNKSTTTTSKTTGNTSELVAKTASSAVGIARHLQRFRIAG